MDKDGGALENWTIFHECHMCIIPNGVPAISHEENCPPVRVSVCFRVRVGIRVEDNFRRGQLS